MKSKQNEGHGVPTPPVATERRIKLRHIVPSMVTVFAICAGLTSLRMSIEGNIPAALYLIMLAVFLDAADGKLARYLDTASPFGAELDTLADFFNFGIAPGLLIYNAFYHASDYQNLGWLSCLVLAICCALRLARFNVGLSIPPQAGKRDYFVGVPAPALASLALMPVFLSLVGWTNLGTHSHIIAVYEICIALLAVSTIPTFSIKHASVSRNHLPMIAIGSAIVVICLMVYPWHTFLVANLLYLGSLPVSYTRERQSRLAEG
ncbi:CDP-alcohol phosphatidyltransferase family protein [Litoreibacter janthinus]|uniref:CDP-diacylglycerol---serine O-phosphatidyltransferase n=1 Tax=Litoreibacter janthinus TaxID=670154 RepID=A0A1I6G6H6_9RHOB|nr:phosphatidylcholine/phosphatidylserine synthase [Litoreibacter janthinus]SFR37794.1 CDP-diacylglycerol---serine O-phosphatidyltransferase [Litoreibacter janthinus]